MATQPFTVEDLKAVLRVAAGEEDATTLDGDILDAAFEDLGYDSVALLETTGRIERELGIQLPDSFVADARTPRVLVEAINERLAALLAG
ncbi:acyl carrier protein [Dactylosporangium sp. CA-139066]|uniref:acyl carrier protein n=1 Tax=Dactylosporangium sp. CA-139066 TaxID=3239930 RepID=UPI003D93AB94